MSIIGVLKEKRPLGLCTKIPLLVAVSFFVSGRVLQAQMLSFDIVGTLTNIQNLLGHIGPVLSAVLFVTAGVAYAVGQLMPPMKRAAFHTTAIDIMIGAIVVAVLSVAAGSLAIASTHLLSNSTSNTL